MGGGTVAIVSEDGHEFGRVFFDEGWGAYGWRTPDVDGNGPFDTAEEAALALADELDGKGITALLDKMVQRCAGYYERIA